MHRIRWTAVALVVPTIAALGIACDRTATTEVQRLGAASASPSLDRDDDDDGNDGLRAVPWVFVARENDPNCGAVPYPAGSNIVTSAWLGGMGLPDNGGDNFGANPADAPNKRDPHKGLLLSKNGSTLICAAAGADIKGVRGMPVGPTFTLGFDYRNGGHCGGGAPRFNVFVRQPDQSEATFFFVGSCGTGGPAPATQDPAQWTTVRFVLPTVAPGSRVESISIVFDEGTDNPIGTGDPEGVGLAVIDNIFIDGKIIRRGTGIAEPRGGRGEDRRDGGDDR